MADIRIHLFGYPGFEAGNRPVKILRKKSIALLAYLVLTGKPHARESIAALLWPDSESRHAFTSLRNLIWSLRRTPLCGLLEQDRRSIRLNPDADIEVDVLEFRDISQKYGSCSVRPDDLSQECISCLERAVSLVGGEFMKGYFVRDSVEFEEWQFQESQSLERSWLDMIRTLTQYHTSRQNWPEALNFALKRVSIFPTDEAAHQKVIELHLKTGERNQARKQYEKLKDMLKSEFNLAPDSHSDSLLRQIQSTGSAGKPERPHPGTRPRVKNGPVFQTPFVGRHDESRQLISMLQNPEIRLITLTGMGGAGKTRIAKQISDRAGDWFRDKSVWVPLESLDSPEYILPAILECIQAKFARRINGSILEMITHGISLESILRENLRERNVLMILDNAEHVISGLAFIPRLIERCPGLKILITSRTRLSIRAEWVLEIPGLSFRDPSKVSEEGPSESEELFCRSARRVQTRFSITDQNRPDVLRICSLVQGNPLAIEIASTWTRVLSCREIAIEMDRNIDFIKTTMSDVPKRHRTMRAVFEYSWHMLTPQEQRYFCRLAVFQAGFDHWAARTIAGTNLQTIASFLDKSIIRQISENRYEMHDLIRRFAEQRFGPSSRQIDMIRTRHVYHYLNLVRDSESALKGPDPASALNRISIDIENVRNACRWAVQLGLHQLLRQAAIALFIYHDIRNLYEDGSRIFDSLSNMMPRPDLSGGGSEDPDCKAVRGLFLVFTGWFRRYFEPARAHELCREGIAELELEYAKREWAFSVALYMFMGEKSWTEDTRKMLKKALTVFEDAKDDWGRAMALEALSYCLHIDSPAVARDFIEQSLQIRRKIGDRWGTSMALFMAGLLSEQQKDYEASKSSYLESLEAHRYLNIDMGGIVNCQEGLARIAAITGRLEEADHWYEEACRVCSTTGNTLGTADILMHASDVAARLGRKEDAIRKLKQSMVVFERLGLELRRRAALDKWSELDQTPQPKVT